MEAVGKFSSGPGSVVGAIASDQVDWIINPGLHLLIFSTRKPHRDANLTGFEFC
jgi:hypothetical protein